ncbi:MAG: hypothetical protein AUJ39_02185 [Parcubacteria group bacterium CG1_02_42_13]|nr:MAG: hypothetical protein AUJ39_02185 [Parcubacteria group bacterium CG1_02_42_13]HCX27833.1 hypothetical protein [Candidatus Portnoybacteria bacterium]
MESRVIEAKIGGKVFPIRVFSIGKAIEGDIISPGLMATGEVADIRKLYASFPLLRCGENELMYTVLGFSDEGSKPYGDYTTPAGQDEFKNIELVLVEERFSPPIWARELHEFATLKSGKTFKVDNILACVRDVYEKSGHPVICVGPGLYSESFFSNGSGGMNISITDEEKEKLTKIMSAEKYEKLSALSGELEARYGKNRTMREVIAENYPNSHGLAPFSSQAYNNDIGVSCIIQTADDHFIYTKRGQGVSVHQGISTSASGAAEFNKEALSKGLAYGVTYEMCRELREEVAMPSGTLLLGSTQQRIKMELGVGPEEYEIVPVSFVRELLRGGKPEGWFLVKYHGTVRDLVMKITDNRNAGRAEIDELIYAQPVHDAAAMIQYKEADGFLTHVLLAELHLTVEYLKNCS